MEATEITARPLSTIEEPRCWGCRKRPHEIKEYVEAIAEEVEESGSEVERTPDEYIRAEEGTYNPENGSFACTHCYIEMGMSASDQGWKAP